ncbi:hypothetical protein [Levilactobacillus brevis]|uniref:hypothetical protein n=1 Tax=Levilactobacillus brevis TaxID=1580 RepID=UPI000BE8508C|nr:hypothetical protein [Levilactobacillus brevis]STX20370.1 Phage Related protein [Levilactobacillus brevis]
MQFDTTYLTEAGRSLATGTLGGLDKIQFTRAVASSHDYSATPVNDLKKLTSLEDVQQTVNYSRIIKKDDTTLTMRVDFPSKDVTTAYSLYTVGFYARPENGDEILYGVLPSSLSDYIAAYDGKSNLNDSFQTDTTVSDADNVLITVSQAGSLNEADLDAIFASKHIATIDDIKANIPATVIDGSKPADFKEPVTLEKGAVDGAGNAIATTKNVSDGDAKTLTSAKEYADAQVGDKVKDADTVNWQKTKVTGDDGGNKYSFTTANTADLVASIQALPLGYHTFYCQAGVKGNPSSQAVRGIAEITTAGANPLGVGYLTDSTGDFWSFYVDSYGLKLKNKQDKLDYTPANAANVVDRNPDTGTVSKPTDFTNLTVNGGKSVATRDDLKSLEASSWLSLGMPKGSYKTNSYTIDHTFLGSPLYMKYDNDTDITTLSGSFLLYYNGNTVNIKSWEGTLITLPDGFYVPDEDLIKLVEFLVSYTNGVKINSVSKSGNDIIVSLNYADYMVPSGYMFGISVSGSHGIDHSQYITSRTTELIRKN